jgi:hypothetical protein
MDVILAAAAHCFFSMTLDALGVRLDPGHRDLEPRLRQALVVDRPIAVDLRSSAHRHERSSPPGTGSRPARRSGHSE